VTKRAPFPSVIEPQIATLVKAAPEGNDWLHETKFDGYRILARVENGRARLRTRSGQDWTVRFPTLASALARLPVHRAWIDGEIAVQLASGATSFASLQNAGTLPARARLVYFVFDLPFVDSDDMRGASLEARKARLATILPSRSKVLTFSDHTIGGGAQALARACRGSLEGIVSKRRESAYASGRNADWVKVKCSREQELVIGGFTEPEGTRQGIGALLVGVYDADGTLRYAGKVGTGFTTRVALDLRRRLESLEQNGRPFAPGPGVPHGRYVRPRLVAQVRFTEWTRDGRLRHPVFAGLREDKKAMEVTREEPE
jgi:bifunctional non-homologous end joining protein LigD